MTCFWIKSPCALVGKNQGFGRVLSPASVMKMEISRFSETLAFINQTKRRFDPK